jgi:hypothetical protein
VDVCADTRWGCFAQRGEVLVSASEASYELDGGSKFGERVELDHLDGAERTGALVGVLVEQGGDDLAGLVAVLGGYVALADVLDPLPAGEGRLVEGHVADQVERVEVLAGRVFERFEQDTSFEQLVDDGLLAGRPTSTA